MVGPACKCAPVLLGKGDGSLQPMVNLAAGLGRETEVAPRDLEFVDGVSMSMESRVMIEFRLIR